MKTAPLIPLVVLCDYGSTIKLYNKDMPVQTNGQEILKGTIKKQTGMWEVPLETQQPEFMANKIMDKTTKPELTQYLHAALFRPTSERLLKATKQGFLKSWPGLTENLIKNHLEN